MSEPTFRFVLWSRECPAENAGVKMGFGTKVPSASALTAISQADLTGLEILPGCSNHALAAFSHWSRLFLAMRTSGFVNRWPLWQRSGISYFGRDGICP